MRWLAANSLAAAVAIPTALLAMQLPALTGAYRAGLAQSEREAREMIDRHEQVARDRYTIPARDDESTIAALAKSEPANAAAMSMDVAQWHALSDAGARLDATSPLLRPFVALGDLVDDPGDDRRAVWVTALDHYAPQLTLDIGGLAYAAGGLIVGGVLGRLLAAMAGRMFSPRVRQAR